MIAQEPMYLISESEIKDLTVKAIDDYYLENHPNLWDVIRSRPLPALAPEQESCPYWKSIDNLKSDFRDQDLPRMMCRKPTDHDYQKGWNDALDKLKPEIENRKDKMNKLNLDKPSQLRQGIIMGYKDILNGIAELREMNNH